MTDRVRRTGAGVERPLHYWSAAVHGLLAHLEGVGFPAPHVLEVRDDVEVLEYIDGDSGREGWFHVLGDGGLRDWAAFLRDYHDAVAGYVPPPDAEWSCGRVTWSAGFVVCHGDFGPWNTVWREGRPVGLIDFDHARPADPSFDVAYGLEYSAPFRPDDVAVTVMHHAAVPDRRARVAQFCAGYGCPVPDDVVALVVDQQVLTRETCVRVGRAGIEPQATWIREGYLDEVDRWIEWARSLAL